MNADNGLENVDAAVEVAAETAGGVDAGAALIAESLAEFRAEMIAALCAVGEAIREAANVRKVEGCCKKADGFRVGAGASGRDGEISKVFGN